MKRTTVFILFAILPALSLAQDAKPLWTLQGVEPHTKEHQFIQKSLEAGKASIEKFFTVPFVKPFVVDILPSRTRFDEYMKARWKVPSTQSWMVASGVSDKLVMLDRGVWKTQASEHNPSDDNHAKELIAHELVHVYHGQHNPTGDFEGMDDLGWLVEGLAVYVSGQLDHAHQGAAKEAIQKGKTPKTLAQAWSGRYRYGVCGSMVRYIDQTKGRQTLQQLLAIVKPEQALKLLNCTEQEFLDGWIKFVQSREDKR